MGHIHTSAGQVDQTVTAYVVRRDGDDTYVMLHMHKTLKTLLPVGGHIELNETPWAAIGHELQEESGYSLGDLQILQPAQRIMMLDGAVVHPQPFVVNTHAVAPEHFHTDASYLLLAQTEPRGERAEGESEDIRWLTRDGIERMGSDKLLASTRQICLAIFDVFLGEWQPVETDVFSVELVDR